MADPKKIAVGGHSYGAFMTANLLIHASHLFCCGISRSGAYNRTLTPFGFQVHITIYRIVDRAVIIFSLWPFIGGYFSNDEFILDVNLFSLTYVLL